MFNYQLTLIDAIQAYVKYVQDQSVEIQFDDPLLNQFYADQAAGLCTISVLPGSTQDSVLEINYVDPELEFLRRLAT